MAKKGKKTKKNAKAPKSPKSSHPRPTETFDASLALARPLTPPQRAHLLKIGDSDREFARGTLLPLFTSEAASLGVPGLTPADLELVLDHSDALDPVIAAVSTFLERLRGAKSVADDAVWHDVLEINGYVTLAGKKDPQILETFSVLREYLKHRNPHAGHASHAPTGTAPGTVSAAAGAKVPTA